MGNRVMFLKACSFYRFRLDYRLILELDYCQLDYCQADLGASFKDIDLYCLCVHFVVHIILKVS